MNLEAFIREMPKVEIHVHLEGSIRPETLLVLAERHRVPLPATSVAELRTWYTFTNFSHFIEIYQTIARCLRTAEDMELITREFLIGQAAQNILYSEVTFTPFSQYVASGLPFADQLEAVNRARAWGEKELGIHCSLIIDISREVSPDDGLLVADWAISAMKKGVVAFGLGGNEVGNPPEKFEAAFNRVRQAGLPGVPHAGETVGPASIWGAVNRLQAVRIGHGVRCLEDPELVRTLRQRRIPLEVCPTSNVCLKVVDRLEAHPLPKLLEEGLLVTLNSDDPPMFNTTLQDEYIRCSRCFGFDVDTVEKLVINGVRSSMLPEPARRHMEDRFITEFDRLKIKLH